MGVMSERSWGLRRQGVAGPELALLPVRPSYRGLH
jgi:hypothetical protein